MNTFRIRYFSEGHIYATYSVGENADEAEKEFLKYIRSNGIDVERIDAVELFDDKDKPDSIVLLQRKVSYLQDKLDSAKQQLDEKCQLLERLEEEHQKVMYDKEFEILQLRSEYSRTHREKSNSSDTAGSLNCKITKIIGDLKTEVLDTEQSMVHSIRENLYTSQDLRELILPASRKVDILNAKIACYQEILNMLK